jgi:signal transduction histidine kinase
MSAASAVERVRSARRFSNPEITAVRIAAMQHYVGEMSQDFITSLEELRGQIALLFHDGIPVKVEAYLKIINDNLDRMEKKIHQLRTLKQDKTVPYIKNIRMIDLS